MTKALGLALALVFALAFSASAQTGTGQETTNLGGSPGTTNVGSDSPQEE